MHHLGRGKQATREDGGAEVLWRPPAGPLRYRGREEEEGYCYRAGGGQLGGAMAFSGWVEYFTISVEELTSQSHPVHPESMVVEDESLGGRLQKDPLSLLLPRVIGPFK